MIKSGSIGFLFFHDFQQGCIEVEVHHRLCNGFAILRLSSLWDDDTIMSFDHPQKMATEAGVPSRIRLRDSMLRTRESYRMLIVRGE